MFYDTDFLSKRRDGFAIYWLASTIGTSNTKFKRLTKKELLKCDVVKACDKLINPEEPLALRLSSNLMLGVTRVYNQQCIHLHQDTAETHANLQKAIIQMRDPTTGATINHVVMVDPTTGALKHIRGGKGGIDQDNNTSKKGGDAIRLGIRKADEVLGGLGLGLFGGLDDDNFWAMEDQLGRRDLRPRGREQSTPMIDSEDAFETMSVLGVEEDEEYVNASRKKGRKGTGKDGKTIKKEKATIARPEDINLPAHQLNLDYELDQMDEQIPGMGFDPIENQDFELGLELDDLPAPLDQRGQRGQREGSAGTGFLNANLGGPATSTAGGPAYFNDDGLPREDGPNDMGNEQAAFGFDLDLGLDQQRAGSPILPPQDDEFAMPLDADRQATPRARSPSAALPTPPGSAEKAAKKAAAAKRKRAKKIAATIKDGKIEFEMTDLAKARDAYSEETKRANEDAEMRKYANGEAKRAKAMCGGVPRMVGAHELADFYKKAFDLSFLAKKPQADDKVAKKTAKRAREHDEEDALIDIRQRQREQTAIESNLGLDRHERHMSAQPGYDAQDYGQQNYGYDDPYGQQNGYDDFQPKREGSVVESAIGREQATSLSHIMPWNRTHDGEDAYSYRGGPGGISSSMREVSIARRSIGSPAAVPGRSRSPSVSLLRDLHARKSATPIAPGTRAATPMDVYDDGLPPALGQAGNITPESMKSASASASASGTGTRSGEPESQASVLVQAEPGRTIKVKEETARFLDYARRKSRAGDGEELLLFSDIVPVADSNPFVAANAFYHLLVLASKSVIVIDGQEEPYGEISISLK